MNINSYIAKQFRDPKGFGGSLVSLIMNRQNRLLYDETIRLLSLSDSDRVLDIGCGNGYVLNLLARQYNAIFAGIDPSEEIIKAAVRRNRKYIYKGRKDELHLSRCKHFGIFRRIFQQGILH